MDEEVDSGGCAWMVGGCGGGGGVGGEKLLACFPENWHVVTRSG